MRWVEIVGMREMEKKIRTNSKMRIKRWEKEEKYEARKYPNET